MSTPKGRGGNPHDPEGTARDMRETFARMAMNDEETVALTAGGHAFGKAHGAHPADTFGGAPESEELHLMGFGWLNDEEEITRGNITTSGIEGAWSNNPTQWGGDYFRLLFKYDYELVQSPAGANQWQPIGQTEEDMAPDARDPSKKVPTMMTTADMALKRDPEYAKISERFHERSGRHSHDAFARAWFKLTHRDMGPRVNYHGPFVPQEDLIWQDPIPAGSTSYDVDAVKAKIADSGLSAAEMIATAWDSARTCRGSDHARRCQWRVVSGLHRRRTWAVNQPDKLAHVLEVYEAIAADFDTGRSVSIADLIVLGGSVGIEKAARAAGHKVEVPFTPGRTDASQEQTDVEGFAVLEPKADGFRNYLQVRFNVPTEELLVDRAHLLGLSIPELAALVGGLRVLGANSGNRPHGVFTDKVGVLSTDFFRNLLDMGTKWVPVDGSGDEEYVGTDRATGAEKWRATRTDLVFGSNSTLCAQAEVYAESGAEGKFVCDFISAWNKVMNADRFDVSYALMLPLRAPLLHPPISSSRCTAMRYLSPGHGMADV